MTDEEKKIVQDYKNLIKGHGWKTFDSPLGVAWFGGKTHATLADYLPEDTLEKVNFEDLDFLVVGWQGADK